MGRSPTTETKDFELVRYWDASALIPLVVAEPGSDLVRCWLEDDAHVVTWAWTQVELRSALERRVRDGVLTRDDRRVLVQRFGALALAWDEITDVSAVRSRALPLLARHPLRAADAAQLGAALLLAEGDPASVTMACLDRRLAEAAEKEGLQVLTWS